MGTQEGSSQSLQHLLATAANIDDAAVATGTVAEEARLVATPATPTTLR